MTKFYVHMACRHCWRKFYTLILLLILLLFHFNYVNMAQSVYDLAPLISSLYLSVLTSFHRAHHLFSSEQKDTFRQCHHWLNLSVYSVLLFDSRYHRDSVIRSGIFTLHEKCVSEFHFLIITRR